METPGPAPEAPWKVQNTETDNGGRSFFRSPESFVLIHCPLDPKLQQMCLAALENKETCPWRSLEQAHSVRPFLLNWDPWAGLGSALLETHSWIWLLPLSTT